MSIDLGTLSIVLVITTVMQAAAIWALYWMNKNYNGIGWWASGFAFAAVGFVFMILRGTLAQPPLFTIILGNSLFILGLISVYIGSMRFLSGKVQWKLMSGCFAAFVAALFFYTYVDYDINMRSGVIAISLAALLFLNAHGLFFNKIRSIRASSRFIAAVMTAHACFYFVRALTIATVSPVGGLFDPTAMNIAIFLLQLIQGVLLTFGLIIMVNQRLTTEIRETKERFELIFNTSPDAALTSSLQDGTIENVNEGFTALTGFTRDDAIGKSVLELNIWKNPAERQKVVDELQRKGVCENFESPFLRKDGTQVIGMTSAKLFTLEEKPYIISVTRDITDIKKAEAARRHSAKIQAILGKIAEATILSHSLYELYETVHRLVGQVLPAKNFYIALLDEEGGQIIVPYCLDETNTVPRNRPVGRGLTEYVMRLGRPVHLRADDVEDLHKRGEIGLRFTQVDEYLGVPLTDSRGKAFGVVAFNLIAEQQSFSTEEIEVLSIIAAQISMAIERKRAEEELQRHAIMDGLTGVFNRRHFLARANEELHRISRYNGCCSMLMLDIDHFKKVNDSFGHSVGDAALQRITGLCVTSLRETDLIGRIGGEEFTMLLLEAGAVQAQEIAERLRQSIEETVFFTEQGVRVPLRVSIGVAEYRVKSEVLAELMIRADKALYRAKHAGRNKVVVVA